MLETNGKFLSKIKNIYLAKPEKVIGRSAALIEEHRKNFYPAYINLFSSPGRIEVTGNHTDHNNGCVLAAAVTVDTLAAVSKNDTGIITVKSKGYPDVVVNAADVTMHPEEKGTSDALVRGVLKGFKDRGYAIGGFDATTESDVFKGAGMSSSASFEVLVSEILNDYYNGGNITPVEKAVVSQYAENVYFGKPSGLMDQSAIALGGVSFIDFKDTKNPVVKKQKWSFQDVSVAVINCGGDHCDLTPNYAAIKSDMESAAKYFGADKLRFVDEKKFYNSLGEMKKTLSGRAILRAMHFFEENKRVFDLVKALKAGDEGKVFDIINASGQSSSEKLKNLYPEGAAEMPIPLALAVVKGTEGVVAARVHGGGFAGTILTFVKNEQIAAFKKKMSALYGAENVYIVGIRPTGTEKIL